SVIPETFCQNQPFEAGPTEGRLYTLVDMMKEPILKQNRKLFWQLIGWRYNINQFYKSSWNHKLFNKNTEFMIFNENFTYRRETLLLGVVGFHVEPEAKKYFDEFMRIAQENHIKVLMYFMPVADFGYWGEKGFYPGFQAEFPKLAGRYPHLKV